MSKWMALQMREAFGKPDSHKGYEWSTDIRISALFTYLQGHREDFKTFLCTPDTCRRVTGGMDLSRLETTDLLTICSDAGCGTVLMDKTGEEKPNFLYMVKDDSIMIEVFLGGSSKHGDISMTASGTEDASRMMRRFVGSVIVDKNGLTYAPSCAYYVVGRWALLNKEKAGSGDDYMRTIKSRDMLKDCLRISKELKRNGEASPFYQTQVELYKQKYAVLDEAFKIFVFLRTAQTYRADYVTTNEPTCTYRRGDRNELRDYYLVDSLWDKEINVINPFSVRGHFRRQACGKGRAERRLIYVDAFMKQGYHRRATKDLANERI